MRLLADYWFVTVPLVLGLFWLLCSWVVFGPVLGKRMLAAARADGWDPERDYLGDWRRRGCWRWVRVFEVAFVAYHFPLILPTLLLSKNKTSPTSFVLIPVQAAMYVAVLWGINLLVG